MHGVSENSALAAVIDSKRRPVRATQSCSCSSSLRRHAEGQQRVTAVHLFAGAGAVAVPSAVSAGVSERLARGAYGARLAAACGGIAPRLVQRGRRGVTEEGALWRRHAIPLACVVAPALGTVVVLPAWVAGDERVFANDHRPAAALRDGQDKELSSVARREAVVAATVARCTSLHAPFSQRSSPHA